MIICRGSDSIASWLFSSPRSPAPPPRQPREELAWAIGCLRLALEILERDRLLVPVRVVISMSASRARLVPSRIEQATTCWSEVRRSLDAVNAAWPDEVPTSVEVVGTGAVLVGEVDRWMPDVLSVNATLLGSWGGLSVDTWCDAWLPYDLRGRAQPEICRANAPRLVGAVKEIERVIGVEPLRVESKFSRGDGYVLESRMFDEDEALDLFDLGFDESWIAAE